MLSMDKLLSEIEAFMDLTGLSAHRTGIVLARNGRLVERLRGGGRVWPDKAEEIRAKIKVETALREQTKGAA